LGSPIARPLDRGGARVNHLRHNLALVRTGPMFEKVNSLPSSQHHLPANNRNRQADRQERGLDMGRHIVGALVGMSQIGHLGVGRGRHEPVKKLGQVSLYLGIGVLLDEERTRGVPDEKRQHAIARNPSRDVLGELVKAGAGGGNGEGGVHHKLLARTMRSIKSRYSSFWWGPK